MRQPLFIKWHKINEIGIPLIDEQHRGIVSIINTFFFLMKSDINNQILYSCVSDAVKNYTRIHFFTEETCMLEAGYPEIEEHREIHRNLSLDIERKEQESIRANSPAPLLDFLKAWWVRHINEEDRAYSECLILHYKLRHQPRAGKF
jgi:hemerythrin